MSARRLLALARALPAEGALRMRLSGGWSSELELLATIAEAVHFGTTLFHAAHKRRHDPGLEPLRIPRPLPYGVQVETRPATAAEIKELFGLGGQIRYTPSKEKVST